LVVLADGKSFAVEVKNSWQNVSPSEISKLVDVAKKLRPDVAMLSVMESGRKKKKALENAAQELADAGIHFELLTLDQMPLTDNPHLPG
jgi:predicted regulator of amino acid metabolism with ACT domain